MLFIEMSVLMFWIWNLPGGLMKFNPGHPSIIIWIIHPWPPEPWKYKQGTISDHLVGVLVSLYGSILIIWSSTMAPGLGCVNRVRGDIEIWLHLLPLIDAKSTV